MVEINQQEILFKLNILEQQMQNMQQQLQAVDQGIIELQSLSLGLGDLKGKVNEEILAPIGKGIFIKSKLLSDKLIIDVGDKNFVEKEIPDAQKLIENQVNKLSDIKVEIEKNLDAIGEEITKTIEQAQELESSGNFKEHEHSHNCQCGDEECEECDCEHEY